MKQKQSCPTDRLSRLMEDELSPVEADEVLDHLHRCESCQANLVASAADDSWWERASRALSDVATDSAGLVPPQTISLEFVETLVDARSDNESSDDAIDLTSMLEPPTHPEMLGRIDEFDIESKIGQGGMGLVFRGFDRSLNRPVAIKIMSPHLGSNSLARQRFTREAQAAAAVVSPYVVPIYRVSDSPHRPYIAMALVDGRSLQEHVDSDGPMAVKDIVRVAAQVAEGLAAAHQQGLVHRDVKPANVLIEKDISRIWITDFGLARAIDDISMTQSGCLAGTPHYMSPEHVTGGDVDHRSDLFSLGGLMYFSLPDMSHSAPGTLSR